MLTLPLLWKLFIRRTNEGMSGNKKKGNINIEKDLMVFPPAIPFHPKAKKKADDEKEDETKNVTFKVAIGRGDVTKAEKTEWSFRVFEDGGDAEDYVKWRIRFEELAEAMHLDTPDKKFHVLQQALRGEARARFNAAFHSIEIPTNASPTKEQELSEKRLKKGYNALAKQLFVPVDSAWRRQRSYLRYHVKFGNMTVAEFRRRLMEQNEFLKFFPTPAGKNKSVSKLTEEELVEIVDRKLFKSILNIWNGWKSNTISRKQWRNVTIIQTIMRMTELSPEDERTARKRIKKEVKEMPMPLMAIMAMATANYAVNPATTRLIVGRTIEMQANVHQGTKPIKISDNAKTTNYLASLRSR